MNYQSVWDVSINIQPNGHTISVHIFSILQQSTHCVVYACNGKRERGKQKLLCSRGQINDENNNNDNDTREKKSLKNNLSIWLENWSHMAYYTLIYHLCHHQINIFNSDLYRCFYTTHTHTPAIEKTGEIKIMSNYSYFFVAVVFHLVWFVHPMTCVKWIILVYRIGERSQL